MYINFKCMIVMPITSCHAWGHAYGHDNVMFYDDNMNRWEHDIDVLEIDGYQFQKCVLSLMWTLFAHMITCQSYVKMCSSHVDVIGHLIMSCISIFYGNQLYGILISKSILCKCVNFAFP
jgi:hypothetical protein